MPNFLFRNLNGKDNDASVVRLAGIHSLDILIFAEYSGDPTRLLRRLNDQDEPEFHFLGGSQYSRIRIFTRFGSRFVVQVRDGSHYLMHRLLLPARAEVLLVSAHLSSKLHSSPASQVSVITEMASDIRDQETKLGHRRTVLVGDLNVNPFEHGVIGANGLHAVMSRVLALKESRVVGGKEYPFFYNPMWGHFGDLSESSPGTYYYHKAEHVNYFWNMFDQVMIRSELITGFPRFGPVILTSDCLRDFLKSDGTPDAKISDHLPIMFSLDF